MAILLGLAGAAAIGVPLNALYLQEGRHPAPLFQASVPAAPEPAARANRAAAALSAPLPPSRPASVAPSSRPATAKTDIAKAEPVRAAREPRDPISQLLDSGSAKSESADKGDRNVFFAQRALVKLGYVLRPDGVFGGTTRQAVEKFERDIGLPVKGELSQKILRRLAARSGLASE
jgi:hypothetical protein